ncbi:hypothetical protein KEM63_09685 [Halopseudomonas nanhaiensis]|uniref:hypothetical protein n=1 Tax=Halopseudomonas nanhaiensis TaxID=2830842 RepID=UPI001CBAD5A1|nr:hypothetical protein [Halopseudomonas nanhaiensis]UAW97106.1 hypothetical protein KEM63_09685 [Halopseudomonas nanhaiensis]
MLELSKRSQIAVGIALVLLMAMTRGSHFNLVDLPSASWAVFFLAGVLLRPRWVFPALFLQATFMDVMSVGWTNAGHHCMTVAYWMLVPAYGALWFGGRLYARWHQDSVRSLSTLAAVMAGSALVCQLFSSGGFYFFSGRYAEPTFVGMLERIAVYYPQYLSTMAFYVAIAALLYAAFYAAAPLRGGQDHRV